MLLIGISMKGRLFWIFYFDKKKNRMICNLVFFIFVRLYRFLFIKGIEIKVFYFICLGKKKFWVKMVFLSLYIILFIINEIRYDLYLDVIKIVMIVFLMIFIMSVFFIVLMYWS